MEILLFATLARQVRHEHIEITRVVWCVHACARGGVRPGYYCTVSSDSDYSSQKYAFLQVHYCININIIRFRNNCPSERPWSV